LVGKYNSLLSTNKNLGNENKQLKTDLKQSKAEFKESDLEVSRLSGFVISEDLEGKFNAWNQKMVQQQKVQERMREFGRER